VIFVDSLLVVKLLEHYAFIFYVKTVLMKIYAMHAILNIIAKYVITMIKVERVVSIVFA
jgi:hypothetical protein